MIIITATGRDRPGMVAAISQKLFDANCNIEDTTMTRLSGEFAMILVVAPPSGLIASDLQERLASLQASHGLRIHCNAFDESAGGENEENQRYILSVYGPDRTGLVANIAELLATYSVNITDLQTRVAAGHSVYVMIFELELPVELDTTVFDQSLKETSQKLGVEYSLRAVDEDTL